MKKRQSQLNTKTHLDFERSFVDGFVQVFV